MTYSEIVRRLGAAGAESPRYEASVLVERFAGIPPHELLYRPDDDIPSPELEAAVSRRVSREPLQYITGTAGFYGLEFSVSPDCLCPRPDTETLVSAAVAELPAGCRFADIGTGSGCVAVSVLKARPDLRAVCADISAGALAVAGENARRLGVAERAEFVAADALSPDLFRITGPVGAVVSNPPYIPSGDIGGLQPEVLREPRIALDGGEDGLLFYRAVAASAAGAGTELLLFETGCGMAGDVAAVAAEHGYSAETRTDLSGRERVVLLRLRR